MQPSLKNTEIRKGGGDQNTIDHEISRDYAAWKTIVSGASGDSLVVTGESQDKLSLTPKAPNNTS